MLHIQHYWWIRGRRWLIWAVVALTVSVIVVALAVVGGNGCYSGAVVAMVVVGDGGNG